MKNLILAGALVFSAQSFAAPVNQYLQGVANNIEAVLSMKGDDASKIGPLCSLLSSNVAMQTLAQEWLGSYINMASDQQGVAAFEHLMPSILITLAKSKLGLFGGAGIDVSSSSSERSPGEFSVPVTVHTANGRSMSGNAIVMQINGHFRLVDAEYLFFSGSALMKNDFQNRLHKAAAQNPNKPVTQVVQDEMASSGFIRCP